MKPTKTRLETTALDPKVSASRAKPTKSFSATLAEKQAETPARTTSPNLVRSKNEAPRGTAPAAAAVAAPTDEAAALEQIKEVLGQSMLRDSLAAAAKAPAKLEKAQDIEPEGNEGW